MDVRNFFGLFLIIVNIISAFSIFSQIRLTYQRKNTIGLSRVPWMMGTTNAFAGLIYSFMISDLPFIFANLAWFTVNAIMLVLVLYYGRAPKTSGIEQ